MILIKAICMNCLRVRDCYRVPDFGFLCEECYSPQHHGGVPHNNEHEKDQEPH
jgi:hypothetical protein